MKKRGFFTFTKVIALILILIITSILVLGYMTYQQGKKLINIVRDINLREDIQALIDGDCSKVEVVEQRSQAVKEQLISSCKNPVLKSIIENQIKKEFEIESACNQINRLEELLIQNMEEIKNSCEEKNADKI